MLRALVELSGARQANVSSHLRVLREAGAGRTPAGRYTFYRLRRAAPRYVDWELGDPAGKGTAPVRCIRAQVDTRVRALLAALLPGAPEAVAPHPGRSM